MTSATAAIASAMSSSSTAPMQPMRKVLASARRPGKLPKPRRRIPSYSASNEKAGWSGWWNVATIGDEAASGTTVRNPICRIPPTRRRQLRA